MVHVIDEVGDGMEKMVFRPPFSQFGGYDQGLVRVIAREHLLREEGLYQLMSDFPYLYITLNQVYNQIIIYIL